MSHYFTELALYILLAYLAGCLIGGFWRRSKPVPELVATRATTPEQREPVSAQPFDSAPVAHDPASAAATLKSQFEQTSTRFLRPVGLTSPRGGKPDNLSRIVGDEAKTLAGLKSIGVYHFDQIARWSDEHTNWVGDHLKFGDRVKRDQWVKKARLLADGNESEFQKLFGQTSIRSEDDMSFRVQPLPSSKPPSDDLKRLKGIGPENEKALNALGIRRYEQIAIWSSRDIERVEKNLEFDGRIAREEWVKQAQLLADEDYERFETLFGDSKASPKRPKQQVAAQFKSSQARERKAKAEPAGKPKGLSAPRGKPDNLQRLNGVGPKYEKILHSLGFFHFDQIASWTAQQIAWIDNHLNFNGRIERDEWIRQAQLLAEGNDEQFERDYGTGGLKNAQGEIQPGNRTRKN